MNQRGVEDWNRFFESKILVKISQDLLPKGAHRGQPVMNNAVFISKKRISPILAIDFKHKG